MSLKSIVSLLWGAKDRNKITAEDYFFYVAIGMFWIAGIGIAILVAFNLFNSLSH